MKEMKEPREALKSIRDALSKLKGEDIEFSALISNDGKFLFSDDALTIQRDLFAALSATVLEASKSTTELLRDGCFDSVTLHTSKNDLVITEVGKNVLLVALSRGKGRDVKTLLKDVKKVSDEIKAAV